MEVTRRKSSEGGRSQELAKQNWVQIREQMESSTYTERDRGGRVFIESGVIKKEEKSNSKIGHL